ncbi:hypothetical protein [Ferruginibacter sp.]|nr:hypothetical protein [Ferruginibacter sp.]
MSVIDILNYFCYSEMSILLPFQNTMSLENPISTIRKAVQGAAEELASKELLQKAESNHYDKVFLIFKTLRNINPKTLEKVIIASAKGKELKDKLSKELFAEFESVAFEISADYKKKITAQVEKIENDSSCQNKYEQVTAVTKNIFTDMAYEIKNDPRLLTAFAGKEDLLDEAVNFVHSDLPELLVASM